MDININICAYVKDGCSYLYLYLVIFFVFSDETHPDFPSKQLFYLFKNLFKNNLLRNLYRFPLSSTWLWSGQKGREINYLSVKQLTFKGS